jgi:predicted nuclease of restriction endonuclease-like (RecB) superfamily
MKQPKSKLALQGYDQLLSGIQRLLEEARHQAARSVNAILTATYWEIGRRIVVHEQGGKARAEYGKAVLEKLSNDLTRRFGRGYSRQNIQQMREFYLSYPPAQICQTLSGKLGTRQTPSGKCSSIVAKGATVSRKFDLGTLATAFPLSWSHYVCILSVKNDYARRFYETEALRGGWSVRQLDRQMGSQFYERVALSRNKAGMLKKGAVPKAQDRTSPEEEIKDPYVLEFLGLKDEYSESDLEEALIRHLETFLLELGGNFTFVARQKRIRIGDEWYRVDLVFYHRTLRCLVLIELLCGAPHKSFSVALPVMWRNSPLALFTGTPLNSAPHNFIPFVSLLYSRAKNLKGGLYHVRSTVSETSSRKTSFQRTAFRNPLKLSHLSHYAKDVTVHASYNSRLSTGCDEVSSPQRRQTGLYSPRGWKSCQPLGPSRN